MDAGHVDPGSLEGGRSARAERQNSATHNETPEGTAAP
jgi:hypothetical protein